MVVHARKKIWGASQYKVSGTCVLRLLKVRPYVVVYQLQSSYTCLVCVGRFLFFKSKLQGYKEMRYRKKNVKSTNQYIISDFSSNETTGSNGATEDQQGKNVYCRKVPRTGGHFV